MTGHNSAKELVTHAALSSVGGLFSSRADVAGSHPAVVDGERSYSYAQLDIRTNQLANALLKQGLKPGDRLGVLLHNCLEYIEIELAAAKAGIIVAALNWRLARPELQHCVGLVEPKMLVTGHGLHESLNGLAIDLPPVLGLGTEYEKFLAGGSEVFDETPPHPEQGLVILYTSGTTGMPKGALISHRAIIARGACFYNDLGLRADTNFIAWAPMFHMASTDHSLATLLRGGTVYLVDGYQPDQLMDLIETVAIGWFVVMPGMVGDLAEKCRSRNIRPKGITCCGAMADLVPRHELEAITRVLNTPYLNSFGATETGLPPATANTRAFGQDFSDLAKQQSSLCEIRLVDDQDRPVPPGQPGEIAIRGPTLFSGYWNAPKTNAQDFRGGWFHMGDVMRRNADGTLSYVDRVKYMIKSGGENIYPAEIEQVLVRHDDVLEAVIVRKKDKKWGEVPAAFIVASSAKPEQEEQLRALCRDNLASYKHPQVFHFIEEEQLPRSTTGKIQRHVIEQDLLTTLS